MDCSSFPMPCHATQRNGIRDTSFGANHCLFFFFFFFFFAACCVILCVGIDYERERGSFASSLQSINQSIKDT